MKFKDQVKTQLLESAKIKTLLADRELNNIALSAQLIIEVFKKGGKVFLVGNGGSAADAQHIAADLIGRFKESNTSLPAIALTTNSSIITAIANDFGFDQIFSKQLQVLSSAKDILIAISTSGNSKNILKAVAVAKQKGMKIICFTGGKGGRLKKVSDLAITVPSANIGNIQESHITIGHIICNIVKSQFKRY